jgi:mannosylglycerate hydrolase
MKGKQAQFRAHIISHTHWDREWYLPFEVFRGKLVQVIDRVLSLLEEKERFKSFTMDGQTVVLEDYLEVRPENREKLISYIQNGRIEIGPWYVLADEFLASPESLIRNLLQGMQDCNRYGGRLTTAYTPDSFGHISQLPLLASEFGLTSIVFERGVGDEGERLRGEFLWSSADGKARVFTAHLLGTYSAVTAIGYDDWEYRSGYDEHRAYTHMNAVLYGADRGEVDFLPPWLASTFERLTGGITAYATGSELILLNGSDHLYAQDNIDEVIEDLNGWFDGVQFEQSTINAFVTQAKENSGKLELHRGEFRGSRYQHVLSGVLSTRMYLKQRNHQCEQRLERITEPLSAVASLKRFSYPSHLFRHGWRTLLKNHAHDSICGCSIDKVHEAMMCRYDAVSQVSACIEQEAWRHLAGEQGTAYLHVFNPLPYSVVTWVQAELHLCRESAQRLQLTDAAGQTIQQMVRADTEFIPGKSQETQERISLGFEASLEPLGITTYQLSRNQNTGEKKLPPLGFENTFLACRWNEVGEIVLEHKESGRRYPLQLRFESTTDAGDEYDYSPLPDEIPVLVDRPVGTPEVVEDTSLKSTLLLSYELVLGKRLNEERTVRTGSAVIPIQVEVTVFRSNPAVHLRVLLDNSAEDHRLRIVCSTGCRSQEVYCGGHFDVVKRPLGPPTGAEWYQKPQKTNHTRSFVLAQDEHAGCAIIHNGLTEYESSNGRNGIDVALTLLRAVGWLSRDDLRTRPEGAGPALPVRDGQCIGSYTYDLALYPFSGSWWDSDVMTLAQLCGSPTSVYASKDRAMVGSIISIDKRLVLSCLKLAESGEALILRVWNPAPVERKTVITTGAILRRVQEVRFDETPVTEIECQDYGVPVVFAPREVKTFALWFDTADSAP